MDFLKIFSKIILNIKNYLKILINKKILISILIFIFLLVILYCFYLFIDIDKANKNVSEKIFEIKKNESIFQIAENLEKQNLIKNKFVFEIYIFFTGKYNKLKAGDYLLSPLMNINEITKKFVSGDTIKITITIPEGFTLKQIEEKLNKVFNFQCKQNPQFCKKRQILISNFQIKDFQKDFNFLENLSHTINLEGFLFPDTYQFDYSVQEKDIIKKMLVNFDKKITNDLIEEIKKQNKIIYDIIIMASMIEKEVITFEDKRMVSGILWKRLENKMPLQVDATIPYDNTYEHLGLPIRPICNPGLESIKAAIFPETSEYWYYFSNKKGETIFSKTFEEHNKMVKKYLRNSSEWNWNWLKFKYKLKNE